MASTISPAVLESFKRPVPGRPLKRNAACHQCRKRKLRCDAKRPCGTCLRSHAYLLDHPPPNGEVPEHPVCTFDDNAPLEDDEESERQAAFKKLEDRIAELEGLLRNTSLELQDARTKGNTTIAGNESSRDTTPGSHAPSSSSNVIPQPSYAVGYASTSSHTMLYSEQSAATADIVGELVSDGLTVTQTFDTNSIRRVFYGIHSMAHPSPQPKSYASSTSRNPSSIQAFFSFHIHANRLFHGPSFLASLDLHPADPRFPAVGVLHALCVVGSLYTAEIEPTPVHSGSGFPYEIFQGRWRKIAERADSFAEQQAKLAKCATVRWLEEGEHLVEGLQVQVLLAWFYLAQARFAEAYTACGWALRSCVPLGLNCIPPFLQGPSRPTPTYRAGPIIQQSIVLPPATSATEDEIRRNIFWLSYVLERQQAAGNNFSLEMDDEDVCQLLPLRGDMFELEITVPIEERQWSHDKNVLLTHPVLQTDSFILFVKACMVLSKVKTFNVRFKGRYYAGDLTMYSPRASPITLIDDLDPRESPAFVALDRLVSAFSRSFPPCYRNSVQDGVVDAHLYSASIAAQICIILLHDPHIKMDNPMCDSGNKSLAAARSILQYMQLLASTSYDVSLFDQLPIMGWYLAGRTFVRFLEAAIRRNYVEHIALLQSEISFVYTMLARAGQRMTIAYRWRRVLYDVLSRTCGEAFVRHLPTGPFFENAYVSPVVTV